MRQIKIPLSNIEITKIVNNSESFTDVHNKIIKTTKIKCSKKTIERYIKNNNFIFSHFNYTKTNRWTKENIEKSLEKSITYNDVLIKMGLNLLTII